MILNKEFGNVEDLPFDLRMKRVITYASSERDDNRSDERKKLKYKLVLALKEIFRQIAKLDESSTATISIPTQEDLAWRNKMRQMAMEDYSKSGFTASVEAFSVLSLPRDNVFQNELVEAVETSKISTFGWPIGVMGFGSDEMRPKPLSDGIVNSIFGLNGDSYDFWALKKDGSFYLLKSLFEDKREKKQVFFNTRIVRTTEMLMFLSRLYKKLGALKENVISFHLRHAGLANRYLTSIRGNGSLSHPYGPCKENDIETNIAIILADLDKSVSSLVSELLSPVFMLFDFFELEQEIYDDIVLKFRGGKVT